MGPLATTCIRHYAHIVQYSMYTVQVYVLIRASAYTVNKSVLSAQLPFKNRCYVKSAYFGKGIDGDGGAHGGHHQAVRHGQVHHKHVGWRPA